MDNDQSGAELSEPTETASPVKVFVASPIGSPGTPGHIKAKKALDYIVRKALPLPHWEVRRADEDQSPHSITQKVVSRIIDADLVVVDISDHNPNVFYELAIAHCYKRPVVIIAESGTTSPFDITDQTRIDYDLTDPASVYNSQDRLLQAAKIALDDPAALVTPLSMHEAVTRSAERIEAGDTSEVVSVLDRISARLDHIERRLRARRTTERMITTGEEFTVLANGEVRRATMKDRLHQGFAEAPRNLNADEWISRQERMRNARDDGASSGDDNSPPE